MKMPQRIAEFLVRVLIADNPGTVGDPLNMSAEEHRAWVQIWPVWKLESEAIAQLLKKRGDRVTAEEQTRLRDRARRLDRLTYAGPRAQTPLDPGALFAEAVWDEVSDQRPCEIPSVSVATTTRADPVRRSTAR